MILANSSIRSLVGRFIGQGAGLWLLVLPLGRAMVMPVLFLRSFWLRNAYSQLYMDASFQPPPYAT